MDTLRAVFWNAEEQRVRALWRLLLHAVALVMFALGTAALVGLLIPESLRASDSTLPSVLDSLLTVLIVAGASAAIGKGLDRRRFVEFGFRLSRLWWADFGVGVGIGVFLMGGIFVIELGAGWLTIDGYLVGAAPNQPFALALLGPLMVFVAVGVYEELFSRGYQLRNLAEGLHLRVFGRHAPSVALVLATVISSSVFGILHAGNPGATALSTFNVALAGCLLALGLLWTAELALPIGLHLSWNFCQGNVFGFPVSGSDAGPRVIAVTQAGDALITGGEFGPEAGLLGIAAMLVGAGLIAGWVRLSRGEVRLQPLSSPPPACG
jgi:uncharacterized protein